jgi:hypothetical protein
MSQRVIGLNPATFDLTAWEAAAGVCFRLLRLGALCLT